MQIDNLASLENIASPLFFTLQLSFDFSESSGFLGPDVPKARFNVSLDLFCELLLTVFYCSFTVLFINMLVCDPFCGLAFGEDLNFWFLIIIYPVMKLLCPLPFASSQDFSRWDTLMLCCASFREFSSTGKNLLFLQLPFVSSSQTFSLLCLSPFWNWVQLLWMLGLCQASGNSECKHRSRNHELKM